MKTQTLKVGLSALAAAVVTVCGLWGAAAPANADAPNEPVTVFTAPQCEGTTLLDPSTASGPVSDLRGVFGARLADYNDGRIVPLYDAFGQNNNNAYPPVCGTRYVDGVGPVSEWMFCTDYYSHVCSGADADGNLLDFDGVPIPGMDALVGANPKLTGDQEKIIAYLIQHGQATYEGVGYFDFNGAARAVSNGDSWERTALQILVWCVSDPVGSTPTGVELERAATCDANMNSEHQAQILAQIPDDPMLSVSGPDKELEIGEVALFEITTNVFTSPLQVSMSGAAGTLTVISGPGVLNDGKLEVAGTSTPETVVLGFTAATAGAVELAAKATPAGVNHIGWNQSPGVSGDGGACQVFATFHLVDQVVLNDVALASFVVVDDGETGGSEGPDSGLVTEPKGDSGEGVEGTESVTPSADAEPTEARSEVSHTELAVTGAEASPLMWLSAIVAIVLGLALLVTSRFRRSNWA